MAVWRKSSYSGGHGAEDCVELAELARGVGVRDSKDPEGLPLIVSREQLAALVVQIKNGGFATS
ncbi:DUF397 domain-containing protein [Actinomadura chibensis]|uniref:DUF397 domain-containing protein n=1 Tax=Actinomadura chibensis TaxID=392828 RepID=A0A5D0NUY3_9ACTN|nr:DUF397 domain-containing protein [Actinomadura chibensis]TYB48490.1 DUF397 domain-containing protein [Actinomadura chibensis]